MKRPRRQFLHLAAGAAALPAVSRFACAQEYWAQESWAQAHGAQAYPTRPVRIVVGFPAGGQIDIVARLMGQWLSERLGQQFFIDNRPGAASNIAAEAVVRAPADGHTLFLANGTNAVNATLYDNLRFDFVRDTAPIASINRIPLVLYVHPSFEAKTVPELIAYAKANPGKVSIATPPKGTGPYMAAELLKLTAGIDVLLVPYRAEAQMVTDLLGSQVQVAFGGISPALAHIQAGTLRALGVAAAARSAELPDVPPVGDTVAGFEAGGWSGIVAPRDTPVEIVEQLHHEINAGLADPRIMARLTGAGVTVLALTRADFGKLIADETEKWGRVVRAVNIKPE
jgi:tripartite-type tricarboxylate transporter receptor subunit TctC